MDLPATTTIGTEVIPVQLFTSAAPIDPAYATPIKESFAVTINPKVIFFM